MPLAIRSALALGLVVAAGCGDRSWTAELSSNPAAPITVHRVTARTSTAAGLGSSPATFSATSETNSVSFEVALTVHEGLVDGAVLGSRSVCAAEGAVWATTFVGDAGLPYDRIGEPMVAHTTQFMPNMFAAGPPSACEVQLRVHSGRVGPGAPDFAPIDIGRFCWTNAGIVDGACDASQLTRTVPAAAAAIGPVRASWTADQSVLLTVAARVTAGSAATDDDVLASVACASDGAPMQAKLTMMARLADLEPGESMAVFGSGFSRADFTTQPARCTIELRHRVRPGLVGERIHPTSFCFAGTEVTEGACEGLAPGPAIVRLDGEHATIERGAHREGPFELGPAPSVEAWQKIVASIAHTHDEGIVIAASPEVAHSRSIALLDAAKAARLDVAIDLGAPR